MVEQICRVTHTIHPYECDWKGDVTLTNILGMMMLASQKQERQLENPTSIYDKGLTWIVIQHELTVTRFPKVEEEVVIETEAISYNKFFTYRAYRFRDKEGNLLLDCLTTFAMFDLTERKLVSIDESIVLAYPLAIGKEMRRNTRLPKYDFSQTSITEYGVRVSDIDFNLHVNNAKYFEWIQDSLSMEFLENYTLKKVLVKYEKEILPETVVQCQTAIEEQETHVATHHVLQNNGEAHAHLYLEWERRVEK